MSIVSTPADGGGPDAGGLLASPVVGTVKDIVATSAADGSSVIDLVIADADATAVARAASTGHVALLALPAAG